MKKRNLALKHSECSTQIVSDALLSVKTFRF